MLEHSAPPPTSSLSTYLAYGKMIKSPLTDLKTKQKPQQQQQNSTYNVHMRCKNRDLNV